MTHKERFYISFGSGFPPPAAWIRVLIVYPICSNGLMLTMDETERPWGASRFAHGKITRVPGVDTLPDLPQHHPAALFAIPPAVPHHQPARLSGEHELHSYNPTSAAYWIGRRLKSVSYRVALHPFQAPANAWTRVYDQICVLRRFLVRLRVWRRRAHRALFERFQRNLIGVIQTGQRNREYFLTR